MGVYGMLALMQEITMSVIDIGVSSKSFSTYYIDMFYIFYVCWTLYGNDGNFGWNLNTGGVRPDRVSILTKKKLSKKVT